MKRLPRYALLTGLALFGSGTLLAENSPMEMPTASPTVPPPALVDPCPPSTDPCPPACAESKPLCGPRTIKVIVPPPIVTFRKTGMQVIEAAHCPTKPCAPAPCRPVAPTSPQMTTVMVPYTYYVQVPTYGVVSTPGFGASAGYGAAVSPMAFGAAAPTLGTMPVSFGALPTSSAFGSAPATTTPQQPAAYGGAPGESDCKKQLGEISQKVDKLQGELNDLKKFTTSNQAENELIHGETVKALQRHQDQLNALRKLAVDKSLIKEEKPEDRLKKLLELEKSIEESRIKKESEGK